MTDFAAAVSEHPDAGQAVAEVVGAVVEQLGDEGGPPDLAMVFVTPMHRTELEAVAATVRALLAPGALVGCAAESVLGGRREVEGGPGVALWAGRTGPVAPFHLEVVRTPDGPTIAGWPELAVGTSAMVVLADPFTFPVDLLLDRADADAPGLPVAGGMAMATTTPGQNRFVVGDSAADGAFSEGAVGVLLGPGVRVETVVSQGCRPVGHPLVVTRAEGDVVYELGGRPALERLGEIAEAMDEADRQMLYRGVQFGRVIDEHRSEFGRGDFLVRAVMGGDKESGAIQVGDHIEVGTTAQFQVRDAAAADEDLRQMVGGRRAEAALLFTCNSRGTRLFGPGQPDHDASVVADALGGAPVAGMFCAGEIGPVGGRNFVHGFTASIVLLERAAP
jgi:small ligand-binding sensory domain FIST